MPFHLSVYLVGWMDDGDGDSAPKCDLATGDCTNSNGSGETYLLKELMRSNRDIDANDFGYFRIF